MKRNIFMLSCFSFAFLCEPVIALTVEQVNPSNYTSFTWGPVGIFGSNSTGLFTVGQNSFPQFARDRIVTGIPFSDFNGYIRATDLSTGFGSMQNKISNIVQLPKITDVFIYGSQQPTGWVVDTQMGERYIPVIFSIGSNVALGNLFINNAHHINRIEYEIVSKSTPSSVPEPSAWFYMIAGFLLVGFAARQNVQPAKE
jgi:hypothetical protein